LNIVPVAVAGAAFQAEEVADVRILEGGGRLEVRLR
jgi:hypothetical protein